jgi:mannose-6-phosphate isomerase
MANSDNVLRGGLTSKPLAVDELLRSLRFEPARPQPSRARRDASGWERYASPAAEFELSRGVVAPDAPLASAPAHGIEILLCSEGEVEIAAPGGRDAVRLVAGGSCFVPADAGPYRATGQGTLYRASVPG